MESNPTAESEWERESRLISRPLVGPSASSSSATVSVSVVWSETDGERGDVGTSRLGTSEAGCEIINFFFSLSFIAFKSRAFSGVMVFCLVAAGGMAGKLDRKEGVLESRMEAPLLVCGRAGSVSGILGPGLGGEFVEKGVCISSLMGDSRKSSPSRPGFLGVFDNLSPAGRAETGRNDPPPADVLGRPPLSAEGRGASFTRGFPYGYPELPYRSGRADWEDSRRPDSS